MRPTEASKQIRKRSSGCGDMTSCRLDVLDSTNKSAGVGKRDISGSRTAINLIFCMQVESNGANNGTKFEENRTRGC